MLRWGASLLVAILGSLVVVGPASAASLTLTGPADGTQVQTTGTGARITLTWNADLAGCTGFVSTRVNVAGPQPLFPNPGSVIGTAATGQSVITLLQPVTSPETHTWSLAALCNGADVLSAAATFTLLPPDPRPRLAGRYRVSPPSGDAILMRLKPTCPAGKACRSLITAGGLYKGGVMRQKSPGSKTYTGTVTGPVTCDGRPFARGTWKVSAIATTTVIDGTSTIISFAQGRITRSLKRTHAAPCTTRRASVAVTWTRL